MVVEAETAAEAGADDDEYVEAVVVMETVEPIVKGLSLGFS